MADDKEIRQAPFNMALNTLESIRKWIDKISELSLGYISGERIDPNELIIVKHRMVKQLIMLSVPLLGEEGLGEIEEYFSKIKLTKGKVRRGDRWIHNVPIYNLRVDYQLDACVQGIEKSLQESGHFMPVPDESSLF